MQTATTAELETLIAPLVGLRFAEQPRTAAVDLCTFGTEYFDADVRSVGPEGVSIFFYQGCDLVPWHKIGSIRIAAIDVHGNRSAVRKVRHVAAMDRRAA